ncbi:hypothetical protein ACHWQZ_G016894 [Mnemiopsis leidyi]
MIMIKTGWTAVQRDVVIDHDLENSPLQIKTNSKVGSDEIVMLWFYTAQQENTGGITLYFSSPPKYNLNYCSTSWTNFPTDPPSETDKVWTITLTKSSGKKSVMIHCNDKEVLNVVFSNTTCSDSMWSTYWSGEVEKIEFLSSYDTASDFYRPGIVIEHMLVINVRTISPTAPYCTGLKTEWTSTVETTTQFPVDPGTVVEVTCSNSDAVNEGSNEVTCTTGTIFSFSKEPKCSLGWTAVHRGVYIDHDLENSPLQIKTNSEVGSNEEVRLSFYTAEENYAGGITLYFTSPPKYWPYYCSTSTTNFPTDLPSETDKVWTITLTRSSGKKRLVVHCNDKEVLNVVLSNTSCSYSWWSNIWNRDVEKIKFTLDRDTASDYYKLLVCPELKVDNGTVSPSGAVTRGTVVTVTCQSKHLLIGDKHVTCLQSTEWSHQPECRMCAPHCTGLKTEWTSTIETTTQFPVDPGIVVEVTCSNSDAVNEGSSEVTCTTGTIYTFLKVPKCSISGWLAVQRDVYIDHDLENSPLQIKTNSEVGSNEKVWLRFYTAQQDYAGGITLYFSSSPQYHLNYCSTSYTNFPTELPSETDKVWTITLTRSSGKKGVVIHCNDKEVLNVVLSNTTCSDSRWSTYWSRDVEKIQFYIFDTASDFYRSAPHCTGLNTEWTSTVETTTQFPVDPGTVVEVTCSNSDAVNEGSNEVTCTTGTIYTFSKEPKCLIPGWTAVQRGVLINYDLENSPLQIKTNSEVGSHEAVLLSFYSAEENSAGDVALYFSSSPKYWLNYCSTSTTNFPADLPSETDKVWTITLTRSSGERSVVIHCNDKEVLNVVLSNTTCSDSWWSNIWSRDVKKIKFPLDRDTASDYYKLLGCPELKVDNGTVSPSGAVTHGTVVTVTCQSKHLLIGDKSVTCQSTEWSHQPECRMCAPYCTGLNTEWTSTVKTTTQFPVDRGTVVEVTCSNSDAINEGSNEVTCTTGTIYTFSKVPKCSLGWIAVQRGVYIDHDLENSPLQIKTNSELGSNEAVSLSFYTAEAAGPGGGAGGIYLRFSSIPQYWLYFCNESQTNLPTDLPSETDKVWTITLTRSSEERSVVVHCNDKEVLNVVLSNTTCSDSMWSNIWSRDVEKIEFSLDRDTASDYYKLLGCPELKVDNATVSPSGAVTHGTVVTVTCQSKHILLFGDKYVTCLQSTGWSHKPECWKYGFENTNYVKDTRMLQEQPGYRFNKTG